MRRALQMFEKTTKLAYESARQGLNYRMNVKNKGEIIGNISLHLNKSNQMGNMLLKDFFTNQQYTLVREQAKLVFQSNFDSLSALDQITTYYPDTGLLTFDVTTKTLIIHLARESTECEGVVLGYVMNAQSVYILQSLRTTEEPSHVYLEDAYNFYFQRILNVSLGISFLLLLNSLCFSPKHDVSGLFVKNEKELECIQK